VGVGVIVGEGFAAGVRIAIGVIGVQAVPIKASAQRKRIEMLLILLSISHPCPELLTGYPSG
jgi:hypothetical protein